MDVFLVEQTRDRRKEVSKKRISSYCIERTGKKKGISPIKKDWGVL